MGRVIRNATRGVFVSDLPAGVPKSKINVWPILGVAVTLLSMGGTAMSYINTVNAKADFALAQIAEIKTNQRQTSSDTRDDLKVINAKLDNVILTLGRNGPN